MNFNPLIQQTTSEDDIPSLEEDDTLRCNTLNQHTEQSSQQSPDQQEININEFTFSIPIQLDRTERPRTAPSESNDPPNRHEEKRSNRIFSLSDMLIDVQERTERMMIEYFNPRELRQVLLGKIAKIDAIQYTKKILTNLGRRDNSEVNTWDRFFEIVEDVLLFAFMNLTTPEEKTVLHTELEKTTKAFGRKTGLLSIMDDLNYVHFASIETCLTRAEKRANKLHSIARQGNIFGNPDNASMFLNLLSSVLNRNN